MPAPKTESLVIDLRPDKKIAKDVEKMSRLAAVAMRPVTSIPMHTAACEMISEAKRQLAKIVGWYDKILKPLNAARAEVNSSKKEQTAPFDLFISLRSRAVADFEQREEAEEKRRQERAREYAEAIAREEQQREVARLRELAKSAPKAERATILEQAKAVASAEPIIDMPESTKPPLDRGDLDSRETWSAEVVDLGALLAAVVRGDVPMGAVEPNLPWLNKQARQVREKRIWYGVRFFTTKSFAMGRE